MPPVCPLPLFPPSYSMSYILSLLPSTNSHYGNRIEREDRVMVSRNHEKTWCVSVSMRLLDDAWNYGEVYVI